METYGRHVVIDQPFDRALTEVLRVLHEHGFDVTGQLNVRDYLRRALHHDFRRYVLLQTISPQLMLDALSHDLGAGTMVPTTIAVYELADGETAVLAGEPLAPVLADYGWQLDAPQLAELADRASEQLAAALAGMQHLAKTGPCSAPDGELTRGSRTVC